MAKASKVLKPVLAVDPTIPINIDPNVILTGENVRFNLIADDIQARADSIMEDALAGGPGVRSPGEVEALTAEEQAANPGKLFRLVTGAYRLAGVTKCNTDKNAGLLFPAFVRAFGDRKTRLLRQLNENNERKNMTYIDIAGALAEMQELGFSKMDMRNAFKRPTGPKNKLEPAANGWINVVLSFLDFPKSIQNKIHDGRIGYEAAYKLRGHPKDKWEAIVKDIEVERQAKFEKEEKAENRFLAGEKKDAEAQAKADKIKADLDAAAVAAELASAELEAAVEVHNNMKEEAAAAYKASQGIRDKALKDAAKAAFDKAQSEMKVAELKVGDAEKAKVSAIKKLDEAQKKAAPKAAPAAAAPAAGTPAPAPAGKVTPKPISAKEVETAAKKQGVEVKVKPLNSLKELVTILAGVRSLSDPNTQKRTFMAGQLLIDLCDGKLGDMGDGADAKVQNAIAVLLNESKK